MHSSSRGRIGGISRLARQAAVIAALVALGSSALSAGDWPQILGPHRSGLAEGERLSPEWPSSGPRVLWQRAVGSGFAGVAVRQGRAIVFHRIGGDLVAESLEAATGNPQWKITMPTRYASTISPDDGPRCVPLMSDKQVYLLGPAGELQCVALADGKKTWFRNIYEDFHAPEGYFGAGSSPILEGDKLLVNVGGTDAGLVALSPADGSTIWKATKEAASYSSPTAATIDGVRHVVFVTRLNVVSVNPDNGELRFRFPFGARGPTVNAANPLVLGDHLFVSASYGVGALWVRITREGAVQEWASDQVMSSQYSTCVEKDGLLYGIDGRQDVGPARLRCFDPRTAKVKWTEDDFGTGNLILADGKLLVLKTSGELVLVEPDPQRFKPLASARVLDTTAQALAALSDGLLFVRDTKTLRCLVVGQRAEAAR